MGADPENITGRDRYIICKALAYAIASIDAQVPAQRELSERADMVKLFHALCAGPEMRKLIPRDVDEPIRLDVEVHTPNFPDLTAKRTDG